MLPQEALVKTHLLPHACRTSQWLAQTNGFTRALDTSSHGVKDCIFHDNGLWLPTNHAVAFAAQRLKRPLIISPRGMLTTWALHFRGWKKRVGWWLYQRRDLQFARVLHATSRAEADDFRALGLTQPIAVIPNGVEVPEGQRSERGSQASRLRTALFLGRVHPKKGLLDLVQAWALLRPKGWQVIIAGGDEAGHRAEVESAIRASGLQEAFHFKGAVDGETRWNLYRAADLFVLPSHAENFGIVVAEALACGVPAIATQGTPWEDLVTHRCGWWPETGSGHFGRGLARRIGPNGRGTAGNGPPGTAMWSKRSHSWAGVAAQMLSVYQWMLGRGPKPDCTV